MSVDVIKSLIATLESDTIDSVLEVDHDSTNLKDLLGWTASDLRIYRFHRPMPLKEPEILIQSTMESLDLDAPRSVEDKAFADSIQLTCIAKSASLIEQIEVRVTDILRNPIQSMSDRVCKRLRFLHRVEFFDEGTKTYRRVLRYQARLIMSE